MKIKYVDLGGVSKEMYTGLWEYDNVVDLKEPILIKFINLILPILIQVI